MAIYVDKRKSTSPWTEETCKAKSQMLYGCVGNQIVYVTVTIQDMPKMMEHYPSHNGTIEDLIKGTAEIIEYWLRYDRNKKVTDQ